ncbi:MAG: hypothetical protein PVF83_13955 [Anaerolineales bacterium]
MPRPTKHTPLHHPLLFTNYNPYTVVGAALVAARPACPVFLLPTYLPP